ncbi:germinal-center associated nuclear protein [Ischnura elegans]|uniref:germinal-center associated nuclear protein n=1 Tax=Ischnura elegans TaxID=197161 RepID=UPI001ED87917|nr:germinal-center associated nuclear protein [Ischnura elegans]
MEEGEIEDENLGADDSMSDPLTDMDPTLKSTSTPEEQQSAEGSLELKDGESKEGQQQLSSVRRLLSPEEIQVIKSIYCSGLPEEMNTKEKIKTYFSEFGEVVRVYMSFKKMACTIHFKDHKSAASAKKFGGVFGTKRFSIFWSQSSISRGSKSPKVSQPPTAPKSLDASTTDEAMTDVVEESKPKEEAKGRVAKMALRSFARRKVSESSPSTSKAEDVKPAKVPRARGKRKEKADIAPSPVDVVFSKTASVPDLQEVLKKPAKTSEEKYRVLEARDKLIRIEREKQHKQLGVSGRLLGTCPDMCPEKERYLRESQRQVHSYELKKTKEYSMNHFVAIKQYSRSSADQEEPLPHELRPSKVLIMTMNYMVCNIMDLSERKEENLRDWYFYVWDRTRAIRKDITQQQLCDQDSVHLVEQCARFHIHCAVRLVSEDLTVFDEKINNENLTKCLQTLKHLYHDLAMKGEFCPNEAEFRGYIILMNLGDGNFMWEVQELRPEIQQSIPVRFAVQVYFALSSGNYVRFFNLVKSATYLNACLMHRYFNQVRTKALAAIARSFSFPSKIAQFPLSDLANLLKFESIQQGEMFCEHHGLEIDPSRKFLCLGRNTLPQPSSVFPVTRAVNVIESKRTCSIGEVIAGGKIGDPLYQSHTPHNSFNEAGMLKSEAWHALDQGEGAPVVHAQEAPPSEPEVDREALLQEVSAPIVEELVHETVRQEVRNVSKDLLEYVNKLSMAFLSMYCETFVIDFVRDICNSTLKEMKDEKAKQEREAQKMRKMYEDLISKMSEEAKTSLLNEVVENMCKAEASSVLEEEKEKESAVKEIACEMLDEVAATMMETLAKDMIAMEREEKKKKLLALTADLQKITLKRYFKMYLRAFEKKRQLKIAMQGFPAWISSMSLEDQVKLFGSSASGAAMKPIKRRWSTAFEQNFSVSTQTYPLISVDNVIKRSLMKSITKCGVLKNELECMLKWNVAISVPAVWDGSAVNAAALWVSNCFTSESENGKQIRSICELEKSISDILSLRVRFIKVVGVQPPAANKLCENVNGIVFIVRGCSNTLPSEASRLSELVKNNNKGYGCPLAILVVGSEKLSLEELMDHLRINALMERKLISQFKIFPHHENSKELPHIQMENALDWLAQTAEFPPPLFVQPLKTVVEQLLLEEFWASLHLEAQNNEILQLALQDPNDLISMYNAAIQLVADACCSKNYLGLCGNSDSEINRLNEDYLLNFKSVTSLWAKSNYLAEIRKAVESLKLPKINSLPAENFMELSIIMQDYCSEVIAKDRESTKACVLIMDVLKKEYETKPSSRNHRRKSIYSSPWPSVLKVLASIQLECMNFSDPTKPETLRKLIISRELKEILEAQDGSWWMQSSFIPELFEEIQKQTTQEFASHHSCLDSASEKSPNKDNLWDMKESLEKLTAALSKQSASFARLSFDIESSMNSGH